MAGEVSVAADFKYLASSLFSHRWPSAGITAASCSVRPHELHMIFASEPGAVQVAAEPSETTCGVWKCWPSAMRLKMPIMISPTSVFFPAYAVPPVASESSANCASGCVLLPVVMELTWMTWFSAIAATGVEVPSIVVLTPSSASFTVFIVRLVNGSGSCGLASPISRTVFAETGDQLKSCRPLISAE